MNIFNPKAYLLERYEGKIFKGKNAVEKPIVPLTETQTTKVQMAWSEIFIGQVEGLESERLLNKKKVQMEGFFGIAFVTLAIYFYSIEYFFDYLIILTAILIFLEGLFLSIAYKGFTIKSTYIPRYLDLLHSLIQQVSDFDWRFIPNVKKPVSFFKRISHRSQKLKTTQADRITLAKLVSEAKIFPNLCDHYVDDFFVGTGIGGRSVLAEVESSHYVQSGKSRRKVIDFKGVVAHIKLDKSINDTCLITRSAFYNSDYQQVYQRQNPDIEVVDLEWQDFEKQFKVFSTNQRFAREVLTTNLMSDLYDWWKTNQLGFKIYLNGQDLVLFIETNEDFEPDYRLVPEQSLDLSYSIASQFFVVEDVLKSLAYHLRYYFSPEILHVDKPFLIK